MIRAAKKEDAPTLVKCIHRILKETWKQYERGYYPEEAIAFDIQQFTVEKIKKFISSENRFLFIAEKDTVVGYAHGMHYGKSGFGILHGIGVDFAYQRKKLGTRLLEKVFEYCREKNLHKLSLYTFPVLRPAVNLYLKMGFVPEAYLKKQWWGVDFIFMSKWF